MDYAIVTAFTIPEKHAYRFCLDGFKDIVRSHTGSFEAQAEALRSHLLAEKKSLKRDPNSDYDEDPIAPIRKMFKSGFYQAKKGDCVDAGMVHMALFLGFAECRFKGEMLHILRGVENA